jgi:hypothetical protein
MTMNVTVGAGALMVDNFSKDNATEAEKEAYNSELARCSTALGDLHPNCSAPEIAE